MEPRDVVVIGGGPAGSTVGHLLARAGRSVTVLERERFPRFHIGESLLPANMPLLERLGVRSALENAGSVTKHGARIFAANGTPQVRIRFDQGLLPSAPTALQVVRATFDDVLLRACRGAGAEVLEEHEVRHVEHDGDCWSVSVRAPGGEETIQAHYLVDASGRDTFLARRRRTKEMAEGHSRLAIYAHFDGVERDEGPEGGDILLAVRRDGWLWVIPLAHGRTSIGLVAQAAPFQASGLTPEAAFEKALAQTPALVPRLRAAERVSAVRVTSNYSYHCGVALRDGALAIGDANAFLDPVFSTGVHLAMSGGESAADAIDQCLARPDDAASILDEWSARRLSINRYYWRIIESFYTPEFVDLLLQPSNAPVLRSLVPALTSVFAGVGPGTAGLRARLKLFEIIQALHRRFDLQPRLDLGEFFGA